MKVLHNGRVLYIKDLKMIHNYREREILLNLLAARTFMKVLYNGKTKNNNAAYVQGMSKYQYLPKGTEGLELTFLDDACGCVSEQSPTVAGPELILSTLLPAVFGTNKIKQCSIHIFPRKIDQCNKIFTVFDFLLNIYQNIIYIYLSFKQFAVIR